MHSFYLAYLKMLCGVLMVSRSPWQFSRFFSSPHLTINLGCLQKALLLPGISAKALLSVDGVSHTPSITFRHLPPNSARFSYATEGALFPSMQLSADAVSALRKVRVLIRL